MHSTLLRTLVSGKGNSKAGYKPKVAQETNTTAVAFEEDHKTKRHQMDHSILGSGKVLLYQGGLVLYHVS